MAKRNTRITAWDAAWPDIEYIAGLHSLQPTDEQLRLQAILGRLCHMPLPIDAILDIALAIRSGWYIGRRSQ